MCFAPPRGVTRLEGARGQETSLTPPSVRSCYRSEANLLCWRKCWGLFGGPP